LGATRAGIPQVLPGIYADIGEEGILPRNLFGAAPACQIVVTPVPTRTAVARGRTVKSST
jgi:hypothetical protein